MNLLVRFFLKKYGYRVADEYFLVHGGRLYDSKAIIGVAYGIQFPKEGPLASNDFGGGKGKVKPKLEKLGFKVRYVPKSSSYLVITENDESQYKDEAGEYYHFPRRYESLMEPGTQVVYYKGKLKNKEYANTRLSEAPHYFGTAVLGETYEDPESRKGYQYVEILNYQPFSEPVLAKKDGRYYEEIPESKKSNYWRDGVRKINNKVFLDIIENASENFDMNELLQPIDKTLESFAEGRKQLVFSTKYERHPMLRQQALAIHGYSCQGCGFNFKETYGEHGLGYIHVHHLKPLSEVQKSHFPDPRTDFASLCANCHAMVHRKKNKTLSIEELKSLLFNSKK